jgi:hypothetical protein
MCSFAWSRVGALRRGYHVQARILIGCAPFWLVVSSLFSVLHEALSISLLLSCHVLASLQVRLGPGQGFPDEAYGATALFAQCACESQTDSQLQ